MSRGKRRHLRVLLIAPYYDRTIPSESWVSYKWVEGISARYAAIVLTSHSRRWRAADSPVGAIEVVDWVDPDVPRFLRRVNRELKPTYAQFFLQARRWLRAQLKAGNTFDLIHQINPVALRFPSPAYDMGIPYIIGPLAGSLPTPSGFRAEVPDRHWYMRLRRFDSARFRWDPWLRATYENAALVLGAAPYVETLLSPMNIQRFEVLSETGIDEVSTVAKAPPAPNEPLRLLFVGRMVRWKGVIYVIRAVSLVVKTVPIELNIVGGGEMLESYKQETRRLGIASVVHFRGRLDRDGVSRWYERSHVFLYPSFREPMGSVVFEAMAHGLPVIASTVGGPGYIVTNECGRLVEPTNSTDYPVALAAAIRELARDPSRIIGNQRLPFAVWAISAPGLVRLERLSELYEELATR